MRIAKAAQRAGTDTGMNEITCLIGSLAFLLALACYELGRMFAPVGSVWLLTEKRPPLGAVIMAHYDLTGTWLVVRYRGGNVGEVAISGHEFLFDRWAWLPKVENKNKEIGL